MRSVLPHTAGQPPENLQKGQEDVFSKIALLQCCYDLMPGIQMGAWAISQASLSNSFMVHRACTPLLENCSFKCVVAGPFIDLLRLRNVRRCFATSQRRPNLQSKHRPNCGKHERIIEADVFIRVELVVEPTRKRLLPFSASHGRRRGACATSGCAPLLERLGGTGGNFWLPRLFETVT